MARSLTAGVLAELDKRVRNLAFLVKAEFDSETVRFWTGLGDLTFDSEVYTGAGNALGVSEIRETAAVQAVGVRVLLNGLDPAILSTLLTEPVQGRPITIWMAFLDSSDALITDPFVAFSGFMDVPTIEDNATTLNASTTAESDLVVLEKAPFLKWTHEQQQIAFPGDRGFEFINAIQEKELVF